MELARPHKGPGASAARKMPYAISEQHKQMVMESISLGLVSANPLWKLITAWNQRNPEGTLVFLCDSLAALDAVTTSVGRRQEKEWSDLFIFQVHILYIFDYVFMQ